MLPDAAAIYTYMASSHFCTPWLPSIWTGGTGDISFSTGIFFTCGVFTLCEHCKPEPPWTKYSPYLRAKGKHSRNQFLLGMFHPFRSSVLPSARADLQTSSHLHSICRHINPITTSSGGNTVLKTWKRICKELRNFSHLPSSPIPF